MPRYKIFTKDANLGDDITVEQSYSAFKIVNASQEAASALAKNYPMQQLEESAPKAMPGGFETLVAATGERRGRRDIDVSFKFPVRKAWISKLTKLGAEVIGQEGNATLVVAAPNKKVLSAIEKLDEVSSVTSHRVAVDINPDFLQNLKNLSEEHNSETDLVSVAAASANSEKGQRNLRDLAVPGALLLDFYSATDAQKALSRLKRKKVGQVTSVGKSRLLADLSSSKDVEKDALALFNNVGLRRIEQKKIKQLYNDVARIILGDGVVTDGHHNNRMTGAGEIVAIADSGIDTGNASTIHPDFRGRIERIESWPIAPSMNDWITNHGADDGASDDFSGHGTHVAGSVLGDGSRSIALGLPPVQGMAPEARLVFQAIEQRPQWTFSAQLQFLANNTEVPKSGLYGIPDDLKDLFQSAYDSGARIHNNSWGGGTPGDYDTQCRDLDQFVWDNDDFLVVVAAGNSGKDAENPNGHIDPMSVDSPGTAKNCITVGACENERGSEFSGRYGDPTWWPNDFPHGGIKTDKIADSRDDIVAFSSRGPTLTGRRKPDVVGPGTFVLSVRSSQMPANNFSWGPFGPAKKDYMFMGGTSMASPLVAGAAAIFRQFLRTETGIARPSAALLKAGLVHSAQYINYRFAAPDSEPHADNEQGWGRVTLSKVADLNKPEKTFFHDDRQGLQTGEDRNFKVVLDEVGQLKVTLAYSDYPGSNLVNSLNLIVFDPQGNALIGNDFAKRGLFDDRNNVEGILESEASAGKWLVSVIASEVVVGPQNFALVISASNGFEVASA